MLGARDLYAAIPGSHDHPRRCTSNIRGVHVDLAVNERAGRHLTRRANSRETHIGFIVFRAERHCESALTIWNRLVRISVAYDYGGIRTVVLAGHHIEVGAEILTNPIGCRSS